MLGVVALAVGLLLALAASVATTALLSPHGRLDAAVTFGVVLTAGASAATLAVGIPGLLMRASLIAVLAAWAAAALFVLLRRHGPWSFGGARERIHRLPGMLRRHPWVSALVLLAASALAWEAFVALVLPPYAYDALTYHLTTVATWVQHHNLAPTKLSLCCGYYPDGAELLVAAPAVLLGSDAIVGLTQVFFAVLGAVATAGIARTAGVSRAAAAAAGALFVLTPIVLTQAPTDYVDVTQAAVAVAGLHACLRFERDGSRGHAVVTGLSAGVLLGTKGTGALWAAVLLLALGVAAWRVARRRQCRRREIAGQPALAVSICVILGCWWYVRNVADHGNPLYPFAVRVFGVTLWAGPINPQAVLTRPDSGAGSPWPVPTALSWASDLDFWHQGAYDYQERLGGLGPVWSWLGLPLLLVMSVVLVRRRNPAIIAVAAVAATFIAQPYQWWSRFTMPLAALGAVAVAFAVDFVPRRWARIVIAGAAGVLAVGGAAVALRVVDPASRAAPLAARSVLSLAGEPASDRTVGRLFYPEYAFVDRMPSHAVVVVDLGARPVRFTYPLFGSAFSRTVLPGGRAAPAGDWIVTSAGRPLDRAAARAHVLVSDVAGVRAWRPRAPG